MGLPINIGDLLYRRAERNPDREALVCGDKRCTYFELNSRANRLVHALRSRGLQKGDRVGVLLPNSHEYCESFFALAKAGAVIVPLNHRLAAPELEYILADAGAETLIFEESFAQTVEDLRGRLNIKRFVFVGQNRLGFAESYEDLLAGSPSGEPEIAAWNDDDFIILYTSGTTGKPKGVVLTHNNIHWSTLNTLMDAECGAHEAMYILLPFFHVGATNPFLTAIFGGARVILARRLDLLEVLRTIEKEKPAAVVGVTVIMKMLMQLPDIERYDFSSVRTIMLLGSPLPFSVVEKAYRNLGVVVQNYYGLTESAGPGAHMNAEDILKKPGSVGRAFMLLDSRIVDQDDRDVPPGQAGELVLRGPSVMKGYWKKPEETAATLAHGWLHTGDMARCDEDGFIYIVDRKKDMIISGGENIYPAEIEEVLAGHPKISSAAVLGMPDEKWGETPWAVVELKPGEFMTVEEVITFCQGRIARYKIPQKVDFLDQLPRTATGKVMKKELRKLLSAEK